jgi:hypothetical protein
MTFVEIALGHANPDWELNGGSKSVSFDRDSQGVGLLQSAQREHPKHKG